MNIKKIGKIMIPVALMALPLLALALPQPTNPLGDVDAVTTDTVKNIIQRIVDLLITVSIIIAVGAIVWGSVIWMTAGGSERADTGKKYIWNGIIGAAIVFAIGLILSTLKNTIATKFFGS